VDRSGVGSVHPGAHRRGRARAAWFAQGRLIIAHLFAFAVMHGAEALDYARLLGHRCDNPLCQRIAPEYVVVSSAAQNPREWSAAQTARQSAGRPTRSPRRARELRDMARVDPELVASDLARLWQLSSLTPMRPSGPAPQSRWSALWKGSGLHLLLARGRRLPRSSRGSPR